MTVILCVINLLLCKTILCLCKKVMYLCKKIFKLNRTTCCQSIFVVASVAQRLLPTSRRLASGGDLISQNYRFKTKFPSTKLTLNLALNPACAKRLLADVSFFCTILIIQTNLFLLIQLLFR